MPIELIPPAASLAYANLDWRIGQMKAMAQSVLLLNAVMVSDRSPRTAMMPTRSLVTGVVLNAKSNRTLLAMVAHSKQLTNSPACQIGTPLQMAKNVRSTARPERRAVLMESAKLLLDTVSVRITTSRRIVPSC
jgi:hypothetical protein